MVLHYIVKKVEATVVTKLVHQVKEFLGQAVLSWNGKDMFKTKARLNKLVKLLIERALTLWVDSLRPSHVFRNSWAVDRHPFIVAAGQTVKGASLVPAKTLASLAVDSECDHSHIVSTIRLFHCSHFENGCLHPILSVVGINECVCNNLLSSPGVIVLGKFVSWLNLP